MFINRCISMLLSFVMSANSTAIYSVPTQYTTIDTTDNTSIAREEIIEISETDTSEETIEDPVVSMDLPLSDSEIDLIALVTMAEAEGEPEEGKRLVIDVILNRVESSHFSNTVESDIYAKNAFECMWNGRVERCYVRDDIRQLVIEEIQNRTNFNIHYFRTNHYHNFGKPVVQVGNHYFSTY